MSMRKDKETGTERRGGKKRIVWGSIGEQENNVWEVEIEEDNWKERKKYARESKTCSPFFSVSFSFFPFSHLQFFPFH